MRPHFFPLVAGVAILASCVPVRRFDSLRAELIAMQNRVDQTQTIVDEYEAKAQEAATRNNQLVGDIAQRDKKYADLLGQYDGLQDKYDGLQNQYDGLQGRYSSLAGTRGQGTGQEGDGYGIGYTDLNGATRGGGMGQGNLNGQNGQSSNALLTQQARDAAARAAILEQQAKDDAARMAELERLLKMREDALAAIKNKVTEALTGFEGQGLTVTRRDGLVYVSMDDKLLFSSASWEIGARGKNAVRDLAAVLEKNTDISIMVEGHTDDVPYKGRGNLDDNLDLSAKRATEVVRLLLKSGNIDPARVVAAGRGEWLPVTMGTTPDARSRNRRTEIMLSPRLDELMKLMQ